MERWEMNLMFADLYQQMLEQMEEHNCFFHEIMSSDDALTIID